MCPFVETKVFNQLIREKISKFNEWMNLRLKPSKKKPINWHSPARDKLKERSKECLREIKDKSWNLIRILEHEEKHPEYSPLIVLTNQINIFCNTLLEKYTTVRTTFAPLMVNMIQKMLEISKNISISEEIGSKIEILEKDIEDLLNRIKTEFEPTEEWNKAVYEKQEMEHQEYKERIEKMREEGWK